MKEVFRNNNIDVVIHFAALKSISDSLIYTKEYFDINVNGTKVLTELVEEFNVDIFIFSSSAAVYGLPKKLPINENFNLKPTNPYAETKMIGEEMCHELYNSGCKKVFILRYFNPVGAHKTALLGEHFSNDSKNLVPLICNVLNGSMTHIRVYGSDYNTNDGTGIRDYIHILDLAQGHVSALQTAKDNTSSFIETVNLGTGQGYSVMEIISAFEKITEKEVPYMNVGRRDGDIESCYAGVELAKKVMNWSSKYDLDEMVADTWKWVLSGNNYRINKK